jgi:hypothetical protein
MGLKLLVNEALPVRRVRILTIHLEFSVIEEFLFSWNWPSLTDTLLLYRLLDQ